MTPSIRLCLLLFTALPVQRILIGIATAMAAVALAFASQTENARGFAMALATAVPFGLLVTFPALMASGVLFLSISAPRNFRLLPRFRIRMLAGFVAMLLVAAVPLATILVASPGTFSQAFDAIAIGALVFTCFTLGWTLPLHWVAIAFIVGMPLLHAGINLAAAFDLGIGYVPHVAVALTAGIWLAFGRWYLRPDAVRAAARFSACTTGSTVPPPPRRGERWRTR
jgi:hypothetical protein